ncbi:MAG TPA: DUF6159 family protein [Solirubrobacteraceae bacterium]|jgi:hypothetical protein
MAEGSSHWDPADEGGARIRRSWRLTVTAWRLMRKDRTLLLLAAISTVLAFAGAALIFWVGGYLDHPGRSTPRLALIWVIASFPLTWVSTYLGVALAAAASAALDREHLGVRAALAVSQRRLGQITAWSLLATVVGFILREIVSRIPWGGKLASVLVGAAWSLATLFAIPILALEGCSAIQCADRSARLFKERWGEGVTGNVVIGAWTMVITIPAGILLGVGISVHRQDPARGLALLIAGLVALMTVSAVASAVRGVFVVALFKYAREGEVLGGFAESELQRPLVRKRRGLFGGRD